VARTVADLAGARESGSFAVNVLAEHQREVSAVSALAGDKFASGRGGPAPSGAPLLEGALTWVTARLEAVHTAGDHSWWSGGA